MRNEILKSQFNGIAFALAPRYMIALLEMVNSKTPRSDMHNIDKVANNSVTYEIIQNVAIISVDGGMHKKGTQGFCESIASYETISNYVTSAENDTSIDTILFRVDTGGGSVAGADDTGEKIFSSSKKTVTLYENVGASGGIWVFSASKELYATQSTMLGSIGVVVSYIETQEDNNIVEIVSKNAENKRCSLNGDCKDKMKGMINSYENIFYSRVMRNTGFDENKIKSVFNNGDMIFAQEAKDAGFIKDITTFDKLLSSLVKNNIGSTLVPTASSDNTMIKIQGADMKFDRENLDATEQLFNTLVANKQTIDGRNDTFKIEVQTLTANLEAMENKISKLSADFKSKLTEAEDKVNSINAETILRIEEGISTGVNAKTILDMVKAENSEIASKLAISSLSTGGRVQKEDAKQESGLKAYAELHKGSIK